MAYGIISSASCRRPSATAPTVFCAVGRSGAQFKLYVTAPSVLMDFLFNHKEELVQGLAGWNLTTSI